MMDMKKHPLEELDKIQLDEIARENIPFTMNNKEQIARKFEAKTKAAGGARKKRSKKLFIGIAAAAAVALVGFTGADRIAQLFAEAIDGGGSIGQYAELIGQSSTDQGIKMEVLAALHDEEETYFFIDLKDETGNRLDESLLTERWNLDGGKGFSGGNCRLLRYDPETGTATLFARVFGAQPGKEAVFTLNKFTIGYTPLNAAIDTDLAALLAASGDTFEKRKLWDGFAGGYGQAFEEVGMSTDDIKYQLAPGAQNIEIPGFPGYISGIAYQDGLLHIQANPDNKTSNTALWLTLVHKETGAVVDSLYSMNYGDYEADGIKYSNDYIEHAFRIAEEDLGQYMLAAEGFSYQNAFSGNWQVKFTVPEAMETAAAQAGKSVPNAGGALHISQMDVSEMSVTMYVTGTPDEDILAQAVTADGAKQALTMYSWNEETGALRFVGPIHHYERLESIAVNGVEFALQ